MQINGQGLHDSRARWSNRLRKPLPGKTFKPRLPIARSPGQDSNTEAANRANRFFVTDADRSGNSVFGAASFDKSRSLLFGLVILLHAAVLYGLTRVAEIEMPAVSVPLQISIAISEPVPEKPRIKPKPKPGPQALAEEPVPVEKPPEETQPQVTPPDYKVAHLNNPAPDYPPLSRRLREQGDVILRVYVTAEGAPGEIQLHTSSGYSRLDRAAREAVERWKFVPARRGEDPVGAWVLVTINYVLS